MHKLARPSKLRISYALRSSHVRSATRQRGEAESLEGTALGRPSDDHDDDEFTHRSGERSTQRHNAT